MRNPVGLVTLCALVLASTSEASALIGSSWKTLIFTNDDNDRVEIVINEKDRSRVNVRIASERCPLIAFEKQAPGWVILSGVSYLNDKSAPEKISVLVLPFIRLSENKEEQVNGKIALNFKDCKLESQDIYPE